MSDVMTDAQQKLVEENLKLVHAVIWKYYPSFGRDDDLHSCATIGLCQAAMTWDESKSKFTTYACSCIRNAIRNELRDRRKQLETISLEQPIEGDITLEDALADESDTSRIVDYSFLEKLSKSERVVFNLRTKGYTVNEIEDVTGYDHRKVLRLMRSARAKYKQVN